MIPPSVPAAAALRVLESRLRRLRRHPALWTGDRFDLIARAITNAKTRLARVPDPARERAAAKREQELLFHLS